MLFWCYYYIFKEKLANKFGSACRGLSCKLETGSLEEVTGPKPNKPKPKHIKEDF